MNACSAVADQYRQILSLIQIEAQSYMALPFISSPSIDRQIYSSKRFAVFEVRPQII